MHGTALGMWALEGKRTEHHVLKLKSTKTHFVFWPYANLKERKTAVMEEVEIVQQNLSLLISAVGKG